MLSDKLATRIKREMRRFNTRGERREVLWPYYAYGLTHFNSAEPATDSWMEKHEIFKVLEEVEE